MTAGSTGWRAPVLVAIATVAAPVVAITGVGSIRDGGSPLLSIGAAAVGVATVVYLLLRQRPLLSTVLIAGVVGGWVLGAGIRLAMFVAAEMGGGVERSVGGTVGLILFGAMPGIVLSGLVLIVRALKPIGPRVTALLLSLVCAAFLAGPVRGELFARGNGWVNTATFLLASAAGGYLVGRTQLAVEAWWDAREARRAIAAEPAIAAS
jgi:hypothetical protein